MTATRTPAQVLAEARRADSIRKPQQVLDTLAAMSAAGKPITYAHVARAAGVSTWLVYADGMREHIAAAMVRQPKHALAEGSASPPLSIQSSRAELAMARAETGVLRTECERLRGLLRDQLGQQLASSSNQKLIDRITELTDSNRLLQRNQTEASAAAKALTAQVAMLEADLAGARTSLRQMIRQSSTAKDH